MLGWLAAAAAPILIHLWMRHAHRDMPWAAMEFLREAIKRNARRLKLQQWILLAVRTLLLLLLALAAAKPYLSGWTILSGAPGVHRVLVLDASFSMGYRAGEETLFARSQELARELVAGARAGEVFSLLVMADPPRAIIAEPVADTGRVAQQIAAIQPTATSAGLADTLELVEETVAKAEQSDRSLARHEVLFFTDLTKTTWQAATTGDNADESNEAVQAQLAALGERATLRVVDVGARGAGNVAVRNLHLAESLATTAAPLRLECEVANHADEPAESVVVELLADGAAIDEQTVSLPARSARTLSFQASIREPAWRQFTARTAGDPLPIDDEAHVAIDVRRRLRVLLVEGQPQAARYLAHALDPGGATTSPLEPVVVPESALAETPLDDFACVFLCDIAQFTPQEARLLENYVRRGGGLVLFLGERVQAEAYNEVLAEESSMAPWAVRTASFRTGQGPILRSNTGQGPMLRLASTTAAADSEPAKSLLPATIGALTSSTEFGLNSLEYRHPIAAAFRGRERAGLLSTPVSRYFQLRPATDRGAEVAIALPSGDPFLVTHRFERGRVAMIATTASLDTIDPATSQPWTLLPAWPSFLPIVRELVSYTTAGSRDQTSITVGEAMTGLLSANWSATSISIERPDGRVDTIPVERVAAQSSWAYASTDVPGVYVAKATGGGEPLAMVAVNVVAAESDLARVDPATLAPALNMRVGESALAGGLASDTSLHRWLLYAVLGLLLLDSLLAYVFGGRSA